MIVEDVLKESSSLVINEFADGDSRLEVSVLLTAFRVAYFSGRWQIINE